MQNTTTKTARNIARKIMKKHGVFVSTQTYTNMCANNKLRNLCFIVANCTDACVQEIAAALNVTAVRKSKCKFYYSGNLQYLRIVHCEK